MITLIASAITFVLTSVMAIAGGVAGFIGGLLGIGGGSIIVPALVGSGLDLQRASASGAALGGNFHE